MREFILGPTTLSRLASEDNSTERSTRGLPRNDRQWLYHHTARCPAALQLFLDVKRDYWCLVPMSEERARSQVENTVPRLTRSTSANRAEQARIEADVNYLIDGLPEPPASFVFSPRLKHKQMRFFCEERYEHEPSDTDVCLYNASIVAVRTYRCTQSLPLTLVCHFLVPDNSSEMLRQLLLSLFITHADCALNKTGRLIDASTHREYPVRGNWCANLVRRP